MPLITCPDCGKEISDQAPACPNCARPMGGSRQASRDEPVQSFRMNRGLAANISSLVVVVGIVLAIFVLPRFCAVTGGNRSRATDASTWSQPAYNLTAISILREYETNEVAADAKFRGKVVRVSGAIEDIDTSLTNAPVIELAGEDWHTLRCYFDRNTPYLSMIAAMRKGQSVTLVCIGGSVAVGPTMNDCRVD